MQPLARPGHQLSCGQGPQRTGLSSIGTPPHSDPRFLYEEISSEIRKSWIRFNNITDEESLQSLFREKKISLSTIIFILKNKGRIWEGKSPGPMSRSSHLRAQLQLKAIDLIVLPHHFYQEDHLPCVQLLNTWLLYTGKDHSVVHRLPWMWMETKCLVNKQVPWYSHGPQSQHLRTPNSPLCLSLPFAVSPEADPYRHPRSCWLWQVG